MSNLSGRGQLTGIIRNGGGSGGTADYNDLSNKPSINNVELTGNKSTLDLNISYNDLTNKPTIRNVPETTGAEIGSVLTNTANGVAWSPVPVELPPSTSGENGNVLTLSNGSPIWAPAGGQSKMTLLYEAQTPISTGVITLNDNISNYDLICFRIVFSVPTYFDIFISKQLIEDIGYISNPSSSGRHFTLITYNDGYIRTVRGSEDNVLNFFEQVGMCYVSKVYGIKF